MNLLVVEDHADLAHALATFLRKWLFTVDVASTLGQAQALIGESEYALVLLDITLPDGCGLDLLREIRSARRQEFVLIMSARTELAQRLEGLEAGADDYLIKPFDLNEMLARIRAVTRRRADPAVHVRYWNDLAIDLEGKTIRRDDQPIALTAKEWFIVERLVTMPYATIGKTQMQDAVYAPGREVDSNTIEVYVSQIRRKLGAGFIETVRGLGYRLGAVN